MAVSGSMTCKIKTSYIVSMVDGIAETFTGYSGSGGKGAAECLDVTVVTTHDRISAIGLAAQEGWHRCLALLLNHTVSGSGSGCGEMSMSFDLEKQSQELVAQVLFKSRSNSFG